MARLQQEKQAAVTTGSAGSTGIPCAMVLTVSFVLFPMTMLGCHRRPQGARYALWEFSACIGAPEPHDFAVRIRPRSSHVPFASIASPPHVS